MDSSPQPSTPPTAISPETLCLPKSYKTQPQVEYFDDVTGDRIWQPSVYKMAEHLRHQANLPRVIDIGCGSAHGASLYTKAPEYVGIDFGENLKRAKERMPHGEFLQRDLEVFLDLPEALLKDAVVICADVIEHVADPRTLIKSLAKIAKLAAYVLISTPDRERLRDIRDMGPPANKAHIREWTCGELARLLDQHGFEQPMIGYTVNNNEELHKSTILAVAGVLAVPTPAPPSPGLAIVRCFNDADVVLKTAAELLKQGLHLHFIDCGSTDTTYARLDAIRKHFPEGTIGLDRVRCQGEEYPVQSKAAIARVRAVAQLTSYPWVFDLKAGELIFSPWKKTTVAAAINFLSSIGCHSIDYTCLGFRQTRSGFDENHSPVDFFSHFEFDGGPTKNSFLDGWNKASLGAAASAKQRFVSFPLHFIKKRYCIRSAEQVQAAVSGRPHAADLLAQGTCLCGQHPISRPGADFQWQPGNLHSFNSATFDQQYLVERLTGIDCPKI